MVFNACYDLRADDVTYQTVDDFVVGRSISSHQVHRLPVLLTFFAV